VASWLVRSSPERVVRVRALAGDTVLCSWARHLTLTVPLSTQEYKWVPANCWGNLTNCGGNDQGLASIPSGGTGNTPSRFMLQKPRISSGSYDPVGSKSSLFYVLKYSYVNLDCMNQYPIDPMHKWLPIKNSFVSIKISPTDPVFELIIQKNFYSPTRLVGLI